MQSFFRIFAGVLVGCAIILLLIMHDWHRRPPDSVRQEVCVGNQRQLALIIQIDQQDHGGRFPANWNGLASYGVLDKRVLVCPTKSRKHPQIESGYGFNALLLGKTIPWYPNQEKILCTADAVNPDSLLHSMSDIDTTRHRQGKLFVASFLDGHVEAMKSDTVIELDPRHIRHRTPYK